MSPMLEILKAGPAVTVQDLGRQGYIAQGLTRGGAMDRLALFEAAALLAQPVTAALEMIGLGGVFRSARDTRIALTGAVMTAKIDGTPVAWHGSHHLPAGALLEIGGVRSGAIGYLSFAGGIAVPEMMGAQAAHLSAQLGTIVTADSALPLHGDAGDAADLFFTPEDRFSGGDIRVVSSLQSHLFGEATLERFAQTRFRRDPRANRQGIRLEPEGDGFAAAGGLRVVSEIIVPGDIQVTGDGAPYVLMCESQTTGGYPRIATVLPADLPKVAQAPLGAEMRIRLCTPEEAIAAERMERSTVAALPSKVAPRFRDPRSMGDLLSYRLIDGAINATADPFDGAQR